MTAKQVHLAVDLGASSGRVVAGLWDGNRFELQEVYRFENGGIRVLNRLYWDVLGIWEHVKRGLLSAASLWGNSIRSVGVDTWGVDFALIDSADELVANPIHYRDAQTNGLMQQAFQRVPQREIFEQTGIQFLPFNTLYQWLGMKRRGSEALQRAKTFLMMPDLFHWWLSGEQVNEYTNATTTQFFNPATGKWAFPLLHAFQLPTHILRDVVYPGTNLGKLLNATAEEVNLPQATVILPGTHDTASAVAAVPAVGPKSDRPNWCYISSGTWSLLGVEVQSPVITDDCFRLNFTNEGGVEGTIRLLKNISGLWLVQECRRIWKLRGKDYSWNALVERAAAVPPAQSLINPDDPRFLAPDNMPLAIQEYCRQTKQPVPDSEGAIIRCALDSLALRYRMVLQMAERLTGAPLETIHIVGGGVQNRLLCQMTADVCQRPVLAGPVEATALGNVAVQAMSTGSFKNITEARQAIRSSFPPDEYQPSRDFDWSEAYCRFESLCEAQA